MIPFVTSFVNVIFQFWRSFPEKNAPGIDSQERRYLISFVPTDTNKGIGVVFDKLKNRLA